MAVLTRRGHFATLNDLGYSELTTHAKRGFNPSEEEDDQSSAAHPTHRQAAGTQSWRAAGSQIASGDHDH